MDEFKGKRLLITGGTGSFGKTVLERFLSTDVDSIVIFSRDENKQEELRIKLRNDKLIFTIGDVRDFSSINAAMRGVDYVFHAAALKQVPSCEFFPMQAYKTNVEGTNNTIRAAIEQRVKRFVLLSTDKAVYPINAMGISKAMAEKILTATARVLPQGAPILTATRYGNVMASRGSVIPMFFEKIKAGQPLVVTDPNMTRFLMSLEESVNLVLHAFNMGTQGDLFVQQAPACTVEVLTKAIMLLVQREVPIEVIGTRHGEKLYETLVSREERANAKVADGYFRIPADNRDLNYELYTSRGKHETSAVEDYTSHNTRRLSVEEVRDLLLTLPYVQEQMKHFG